MSGERSDKDPSGGPSRIRRLAVDRRPENERGRFGVPPSGLSESRGGDHFSASKTRSVIASIEPRPEIERYCGASPPFFARSE